MVKRLLKYIASTLIALHAACDLPSGLHEGLRRVSSVFEESRA